MCACRRLCGGGILKRVILRLLKSNALIAMMIATVLTIVPLVITYYAQQHSTVSVNWVDLANGITALCAALFGLFALASPLSRRVFLDAESAPQQAKGTGDQLAAPPTGIEYYGNLATSSRSVARTLFSRSGVFLMVGVLTAALGVIVFFVTRTILRPPPPTGPFAQWEYAVYLAQNTGVLILCELIAFFFLRQSRSVLDEYRHADNIARYREEMLALLMLAEEDGGAITLKDVLDKGHFFSKAERLGVGESTEIVETRKLEKSDIDAVASLLAAIATLKKG
jgi:hypothetical protein